MYCCTVVPRNRSCDSVSGDVLFRRLAVGFTSCNYAQLSAAQLHKQCSLTPEFDELWAEILSESVLGVSAHDMIEGSATLINVTQSYGVFPVFEETSSRSDFLIFCFSSRV